MKKCRICQKTLELINFYKVGGKLKGHRATCIQCFSKKGIPYRLKTKTNKKEYDKRRYNMNRDQILEYVKSKYNYSLKKEYDFLYRKNNVGKVRANVKKYKLAKRNAVPKWLSKEQLLEIANIYHNCPEGYHVDHIEPLRGKITCGLHVPWNLQYLTIKENLKKGNRL